MITETPRYTLNWYCRHCGERRPKGERMCTFCGRMTSDGPKSDKREWVRY
jgi:uncharacterized membrane protein YvbJ